MKTKFGLALGFTLLSTAAAIAGGKVPPPKLQFSVVPLVSDQPGVAPNTDPNLVNPWGLSQAPGNPLWVSDNGTDLSTLYDPSTGAINSLVVNISPGAPTGTVFVPPGTGFPISENGNTDDSIFLFDTESGAILGWSFNVDATNAIVGVDNSAKGAAYKGLAYDPTDVLLFAANFTQNKVEVYDKTWKKVGAFTDSTLPKHFAPFNVAWLNNKLYVAFAKRKPGGIDEIDRKGLGYVDVFDAQGNLQQHLISNGNLDAPWGMLIAPSGFGKFAGALLVGNFGNGKISAYDASTGSLMGRLKGQDGKPIAIDGLWSLFPDLTTARSCSAPGPTMSRTAWSDRSRSKKLVFVCAVPGQRNMSGNERMRSGCYGRSSPSSDFSSVSLSLSGMTTGFSPACASAALRLGREPDFASSHSRCTAASFAIASSTNRCCTAVGAASADSKAPSMRPSVPATDSNVGCPSAGSARSFSISGRVSS